MLQLDQLKYVDGFIAKRKKITDLYRNLLNDIPGIYFLNEKKNVSYAYSYFPVLVDKAQFGISRDELYEKLKAHNIFGRRYFYPLISEFEPYKNLPSAGKENLPVATKMAQEVLCLPIYVDLQDEDIYRIVNVITK
ncbi:hypothetical protein FACS189420_2980 [Bacteroidia bacterium]|nr:hypothetical protein FACS189420_2980 [Bacteroidia bacterium]